MSAPTPKSMFNQSMDQSSALPSVRPSKEAGETVPPAGQVAHHLAPGLPEKKGPRNPVMPSGTDQAGQTETVATEYNSPLIALAAGAAQFLNQLAQDCAGTASRTVAIHRLLDSEIEKHRSSAEESKRKCIELRERVDGLHQEKAKALAENERLGRVNNEKEQENVHLRNVTTQWEEQCHQLESTIRQAHADSIPPSLHPLYNELCVNITGTSRVELFFHLHSLQYLMSLSEPQQKAITDTLTRLSFVLCANINGKPEFLHNIRAALTQDMRWGFSFMETVPGEPIDERFVTGTGFPGCRTVAEVRSWAILKEGVVLRKAEIIPAP